MSESIDPGAMRQLFTEAHTAYAWLDRAVSDATLQAVWDLAKWGPTAFNCLPARLVFVRSDEAKARLAPALLESNRAKTLAAPATIIVGSDHDFHERLPTLFPAFPAARDLFAANAQFAETTAFRNATLQAAYVIVAARALGLDCGPMSGFDNARVDAEFFAGTRIRSNFLINVGYGDPAGKRPRGPRPAFEEDCRIV